MSNANALNSKKIAVIGAGLAGLSCALELEAKGFSVQLFEKSRGPSGRMATRRGEDWAADHGAQYFTARDPIFNQQVTEWMHQGLVTLWEPKLKVFENKQWRTSTSKDKRYVALPGMSTLGRHLSQSLMVRYEHTISKIEFSEASWRIETTEHGVLDTQFDGLVLAIPAPQASVLLADLDSNARALADAATMKACWTLMVHLKQATQPDLDAAFVNGETISWICKNLAKPGRAGADVWTIHANADWSQQHVEWPKDAAVAAILDCFTTLGFKADETMVTAHRWRYASGSLVAAPGCYYSDALCLGLCGDWLHGGRVEGAWLSGRQLAQRIPR